MAEVGEALLPGLPEGLVLAQIMPRLPWYARPVCRAISKAWKSRIDANDPVLQQNTRKIQLPLLQGLSLVFLPSRILVIQDQSEMKQPWKNMDPRVHGRLCMIHEQSWRRLPPLSDDLLLYGTPTMIACSGIICVWTLQENSASRNFWSPEHNFIVKIDIGSGDWKWRKFHVSHLGTNWFDAVGFNCKIYAPRGSRSRRIGFPASKEVVAIYDMMTNRYRHIAAFPCSEIRVLSGSLHAEEMYGFAELGPGAFTLMVYNVGSQTWRTVEELPRLEKELYYEERLNILRGDCFEPAIEVGINIIVDKPCWETLSWYNSAVGEAWVEITYDSFNISKILVIHGSLYGIVCEDEEEGREQEEEEEGLGRFQRWIIMKGKVCVASSNVVWERMPEVGLFRKGAFCDSDNFTISPIQCFTLMG